MEEDIMTLGGSIELTGFKDLDRGALVVLKKMVGNHVRKMTEVNSGFEKLTMTKKNVHGSDKKVEIQAKLILNGKPINREETDFNLFFTVDRVLTSLQEELKK
ncbi:hypothetical protein HOK51_02945 [Candidatus Woesearchaeota archaeon]|jgi:hypothetical protein|nr:hypothetical protein [Candidatus Woesearchaeota archaeon]MBT6518775.1 hypothetical protein [Candidatus Woesearchaeota archaeon]MBT7366923.1 hypothetical protein [Candidatus Woesearchaeota archaeon]